MKRVEVKLTDAEHQALEELGSRYGWSLSDVLRHAIRLLAWVTETRASGGRVLAEREGRTRELISL